MQSLDPSRQHLVIQFLEAAELNTLHDKGLLYQVRMSKANLFKGDLSNAYLSFADLSKVKLCHTKLPPGTNLDPARDCQALQKRQ